jgi:UDP-N-acetylmuramate--L-alanine ligase/UDP-N-acetylenolpyruvoylglucosamine reductase
MNQAVLSLLKESRYPMKINLIGVAGSGMSGLALLLMARGHEVSGSDRATTVETERLEKMGLKFSSPHTAEQVKDCDMVIYSSAIKPGNLAYEAAYKEGVPLVRRAEALAAVMQGKKGVVVAGTHGKTTTSSLCAHVLRQIGVNPTHYVGAEIPILGANAHWDHEGEWFVAEGDESDGTLVNFHPECSIVLNIEAEHLDYYEDLDAIKNVFNQLLKQTAGIKIYCGDDEVARSLVGAYSDSISYGFQSSFDYYAELTEMKANCSIFNLYEKQKCLGQVTLGIPGKHNVSNALAAIALARMLGGDFKAVAQALETFRGAKRRFEIKYQSENITLIDDYGHHPSEVEATLTTAAGLNKEKLVCLFQPHRYSRTQLLKKEFGSCFNIVNQLYVTDIYAASEKPLPGVSGQTIVDAVKEFGNDCKRTVKSTPSLLESRDSFGNALQPGTLAITLGAGNVHEVAKGLIRDLPLMDKIWLWLKEEEDQGVARLYEPLQKHTTFLIGGTAQYWIEPTTVKGLVRIVNELRTEGVPLRLIGRGSNLLVKDGGIRGAVIHLSKGIFDQLSAQNNGQIEVYAGVRLKKIAGFARQLSLGGFEWMEGIPGNLGGGIRMNAGAMGVEMFDQVVNVTCLNVNGQVETKTKEQLQYGYRNAPEFEHAFVISAVLQGQESTFEKIDSLLEQSKQKRKRSQPIGASAGCIFKNPESHLGAGQLIDEMGLKGLKTEHSQVSMEHGNFIVNRGNASAKEVLDLISQIKDKAMQDRGVELVLEVKVIGEDSPLSLS